MSLLASFATVTDSLLMLSFTSVHDLLSTMGITGLCFLLRRSRTLTRVMTPHNQAILGHFFNIRIICIFDLGTEHQTAIIERALTLKIEIWTLFQRAHFSKFLVSFFDYLLFYLFSFQDFCRFNPTALCYCLSQPN